MNYTIPLRDQLNTSFLFTIREDLYPDGRIVPTVLLLSKNLDEINTLPFRNLKLIAKTMNIPGRGHMNKDVLSDEIRMRIIFEEV